MKEQRQFDIIVIGGGIGGLMAAAAASQAGKSVALFESTDSLGGLCRPFQSPYGRLEHGLKTFPETADAYRALALFESILGAPLQPSAYASEPITFHKSHLQPFVGFGNHAPAYVDALNYYLSPRRLKLAQSPGMWVDTLKTRYLGSVHLHSQVTKLIVENGKISKVIVNGQDAYEGHEIIYCGPLADLPALAGKEALGARNAQKIANGTAWTSVALDLVFKEPISTSDQVHVLSGGVEDLKVVLGEFQIPGGATPNPSSQTSQWLTFVPSEFTGHDETTAAALKEIRRLLKRAFGDEIFSRVVYERILVAGRSHSDIQLKLKENQVFADIDNLRVISGALHGFQNLVGVGLQLDLVLESLGLKPQPKTQFMLRDDAPCATPV